jgi:hypothetical protein
MGRFRLGMLLIADATVLLFLDSHLAGVVVTTEGASTVYRVTDVTWILGVVAAAAILWAGVLMATAKVGRRRLLAILPLGIGMMTLVANWDASRDRVTISPTGLELPGYGMWHRQEAVSFNQLESASTGRGRLELFKKDKGWILVPKGDLVGGAWASIMGALEEHGVPVDTGK